MGARDFELLDALEALSGESFEWEVSRIVRDGREPLQGYPAGARWEPPGGFDVLYTSLEADGARAEIFFHLSRAPVFPSRTAFLLHTIRVRTRRTLRLTDGAALAGLVVETGGPPDMNYGRTQAIGDAAHFLGFDSLLVPSARWQCLNLILFMDRLNPNDEMAVTGTEPVDWRAWQRR